MNFDTKIHATNAPTTRQKDTVRSQHIDEHEYQYQSKSSKVESS